MEIVNMIIPVDAIKPHERNYRNHPDNQLTQLGLSHNRFGQFRSIVLWERPKGEYITVAGHGILEAMKRNGVTEVRADVLPVNTPQSTIDGILVADNLHSQGATDDQSALAALLQAQQDEGFDLEALGSDDESLRQMLEALGDAYVGESVERDETEDELPEHVETRAKVGDVWALGRHRLMVGDCTKQENIKALMEDARLDLIVTDPPYGVSYADKNRFLNAVDKGNRVQEPIANDHGKIEDTAEKIWKPAYTTMHEVAREGCVIYCFAPQGGDQMMVMMMMHPLFPVRHQLIWLKNNHVLGRADYAYKHEPILYGWKEGTHKYYGGFQTSILEFDKPLKSDLHPTMKPLPLIMHLIENSSLEGQNVGDWFLGSGTTLIACERTNRNCYGCELDPHYADIILTRFEQHTGQTAQLLERAEEGTCA